MNLKGKVGSKIIGAALSATMLMTAVPAAATLACENDSYGNESTGIFAQNPNVYMTSNVTAGELADLIYEVDEFYNTYGDQLPALDGMLIEFSIESSCNTLDNRRATSRHYAEEYNMLITVYFEAIDHMRANNEEPVAPDYGMVIDDEDDEPVAPDFGMEDDEDEDDEFVIDHPDSFTIDGQSDEDDEPVAPDFGMEDDEDDEPVAPDFGMVIDDEDDEPVAPDFGMEDDEEDEPVAPDYGMVIDDEDDEPVAPDFGMVIDDEDDEPVAPDFGMEDDEDDEPVAPDYGMVIDDEDDEPVAPDFGMVIDDEDDEPVAPDFGMTMDDEDDEPVAPDFGMEDVIIDDIDDTDTTPSIEPVEPADDITRAEDTIAEDTTRVEDIISDDDTTPAPAPVAPAATAPAATESAPAATTSSSSASSAPVVIVLSKEAAADLFVEQLYITVLDRASDAEGKAEWVNILLNDEDGFDKTINGFMNCAEFADRNISDDEFVAMLYKVLFNRTASDSEIATWTAALKNGTSRSAVVAAFLDSSECETVNEEF